MTRNNQGRGEQLQRLVDEAEIRNAVARLAHLADRDGDDLEAYLALWMEDGTSVHPHWEAQGHEGIRTAVARLRKDGIQGPGADALHLNTTLVVRFEERDTATAESYWQYWKAASTAPELSLIGHYRDTFVRTAEGWRLQRRIVTYGNRTPA